MSDLQLAVDLYPWDSQEQKEGYLALISYSMKMGKTPAEGVNHVIAFLIQKQNEAAEYWRDTTAAQVGALQSDLARLQNENRNLMREVEHLTTSVRLMSISMNEFTRRRGV